MIDEGKHDTKNISNDLKGLDIMSSKPSNNDYDISGID